MEPGQQRCARGWGCATSLSIGGMMGQSVPAAACRCPRGGWMWRLCLLRGTHTRWRAGQGSTSSGSTKGNANSSCTWGGITTGTRTCCGLSGWKSALRRRAWGPGGQQAATVRTSLTVLALISTGVRSGSKVSGWQSSSSHKTSGHLLLLLELTPFFFFFFSPSDILQPLQRKLQQQIRFCSNTF